MEKTALRGLFRLRKKMYSFCPYKGLYFIVHWTIR